MVLSRLELLYIRHMVKYNIADLNRRVVKYQRFSDNSYDDVFEEKSALAESELVTMRVLLSRLNDEIALFHFDSIRD